MRVVYDVSFWAILTLTVINLVFGVIVDTFGDLRAERQAAEERLNNTCFICSLERERYVTYIVFVPISSANSACSGSKIARVHSNSTAMKSTTFTTICSLLFGFK